jgi:hypothetical protein
MTRLRRKRILAIQKRECWGQRNGADRISFVALFYLMKSLASRLFNPGHPA